MPMHDFRCSACGAVFELLVRSSSSGVAPACRHCGSTALERLLSLPAPQGRTQAIVAAGRRAAAREGHFSNYSASEKARIK